MDFSQKRWTFVTFRLYYPLWVSRRVDTWHIVYLSYTIRTPIIKYQFIKVLMSHGQHGQRWNLREFTTSCKVVPLGRATFWMLKLVILNTIGKLCAKYQLCAIRTADNTDGKSRKSIVSEKSPSFRPAPQTLMVCSVPSGQLVFSSRPVVKTVRYFHPLVGTSGQLGEYFVRRVRQFMRPSPSWRGEMYQKRFLNLFTRGQCMFMHCYVVSGPTEN